MPSTTTFLQLVNRILQQTGQRQVTTLVGADTPVTQTMTLVNHVLLSVMHTVDSSRLLKSSTASITSGSATVTLASDASIDTLVGDSLVVESNQHPLLEINANHPRVTQTTIAGLTGNPTWFTRQGDTLTLLPTPDANDTLHYQYHQLPTELSADADTLPIPEPWVPTIAIGAQALLEKFLGEKDYPVTYQLYQEHLLRLKTHAPTHRQPRMQGPYKGYQA